MINLIKEMYRDIKQVYKEMYRDLKEIYNNYINNKTTQE